MKNLSQRAKSKTLEIMRSKRLELRVKRTNMPTISMRESGKRNRWRRGNNYITKRGNFLQFKMRLHPEV